MKTDSSYFQVRLYRIYFNSFTTPQAAKDLLAVCVILYVDVLNKG